jgi:putative membrane protein
MSVPPGLGWSPSPLPVAGLLALALVWARGRRALPPAAAAAGHPAAFAAGLAVTAVALVSPLDALAGILLTAHMVQHMLLILVAAPLLALGAPGVALLLALPPAWRRRVTQLRRTAPVAAVRVLAGAPVLIWALQVAAIWLWHLPALYGAALVSEPVHALEHASFLGTAWLFWRLVLPTGPRRGLSPGLRMLLVFVTALPTNLLGALLAFAPNPLYRDQSAGAAAWGLTALSDQQLAGVIMWVQADVLYLAVLCAVFLRWFASAGRDAVPAPSGAGGRG